MRRQINKPSNICNILNFDWAVNQETGASGRRYRNITLNCGRVEFGADATPTGSRWMSNNYITRCHRRLESVQLEFETGYQTGSTEVYDAPNHVIPSLSAIQLIWKYQQAYNKNASWSARRERGRLIATKKRRRRGRTLLNKLFFYYSPL